MWVSCDEPDLSSQPTQPYSLGAVPVAVDLRVLQQLRDRRDVARLARAEAALGGVRHDTVGAHSRSFRAQKRLFAPPSSPCDRSQPAMLVRPRVSLLAASALALPPSAASGGAGDACDGRGQLHALLAANAPDGASASAQLLECVAPLLLAPYKWAPGPSAADYCAQPPCQRAVAALAGLPRCTWTQVEAQGTEEAATDAVALRIARQVLHDCAGLAQRP